VASKPFITQQLEKDSTIMDSTKAENISLSAYELVKDLVQHYNPSGGGLEADIRTIWRFARDYHELRDEHKIPDALEGRKTSVVMS